MHGVGEFAFFRIRFVGAAEHVGVGGEHVVDLRVGSPTYGEWDSARLDDVDRRAIYLSEGLGHAFVSLADNSSVTYLVSSGYSPGREFGGEPRNVVHPVGDAHGPEIEDGARPVAAAWSSSDSSNA